MPSTQKLATAHKKQLFLDNYKTFGMITKTAEAIGVTRYAVHIWLRLDKVFSNTFNVLKKEIEAELIEAHEKNIDEVAFNPKTPPQSRIFGSLVKLRALAPDKYREKQQAIPITGEIIVRHSIPRPGEPKQIERGKDVKQGTEEGISTGVYEAEKV